MISDTLEMLSVKVSSWGNSTEEMRAASKKKGEIEKNYSLQ